VISSAPQVPPPSSGLHKSSWKLDEDRNEYYVVSMMNADVDAEEREQEELLMMMLMMVSIYYVLPG